MRLTENQRGIMEPWLAENMMDGNHSVTWAIRELAPKLGLGKDVSRDWDIIKPLGFEIRKWCKENGAKPPKRPEPLPEFGWERRKADGWDVDMPHEVTCVRCGVVFHSSRRNAKRCPSCIAIGRDAHPRVEFAPIHCETCGVEFTPRAHNAKYCSPACKTIAANRRKRL